MQPSASTLADAVTRVAPDRTALQWHDRRISYRDLLAAARAAAERIDALQPARDTPIGILAPKSPEAVTLVLGAVLTGRPFLLPAPGHPPEVLDELFRQAGCTHVLTTGRSTAVHRPAPRRLRGISFILTTSGSTGLPKIVPLPSSAVDRFTAWAVPQFGIAAGRRVLNYAPLSFDLCLLDVWSTLSAGGTVVLVDPDRALDAAALAQTAAEDVHLIQGVPMLFGLLAGTGRVFPEVRHAIVTGDRITPDVLARLPVMFPSARLHNVYGCTETNDSFRYEVAPDDRAPLPIGEPLPGVRAAVVTGEEVLTGPGTGELWVTTPFQSPGYLGAAEHSGRFTAGPAGEPGVTWYRTGDLVRRDASGRLLLLGRNDDRVKVRGVGVDLSEVEQALLRHDHVLEAAVVAVPDALAGARLHAVVRRRPGCKVNSLTLRQHCAVVLPRGATPESLRVTDDPLPRTTTGKVDRRAVRHAHLHTTVSKEFEVHHAPIITQFIIDEFLPDVDRDEITPDLDLVASGVIDSLGLLKLIAWLEDRFAIASDDLEMAPENFRSVAAIDAFVTAAQADRAVPR